MTTPQPAFDPAEDPRELVRAAVESVQDKDFSDAAVDLQHAAQACELAGDLDKASRLLLSKSEATRLERETRALLNRVAKEL